MMSYRFTIAFTGLPGVEDLDERLYEAGLDDATVAIEPDGSAGDADFDREADSALDAVLLAVEQIIGCGLTITAVDEDLVTLADIAELAGAAAQTVDHWINGRRGPGGFPSPRLARPRGSIYSWAEVSRWLHDAGLGGTDVAAVEAARVCAAVDGAIKATRVLPAPALRRILQLAAG